MIQHLNLSPEQGFILFFGLLLFGLVGWGLYLTVGAGKKQLRDPIDEHAKMHELGIAHGHGGNKEAYEMYYFFWRAITAHCIYCNFNQI